MDLSLAYSPCPNDTFAFHAMVHGITNRGELNFKTTLADVEELNRGASMELYDICKMSYHAFFTLRDRYTMLTSGSALGFNNGPLFVHNKPYTPSRDEISKYKIAIPGKLTTATLLLRAAYPECTNLHPIIFSDIEEGVLSGEFDAGVLIHEGRFTYMDRGLKLLEDLGEFWQNRYGKPIPLGGIAIHNRVLPFATQINDSLKRSIEYAIQHPNASQSYVTAHAQEMDPIVQHKHISLFVNDYTLDIGQEGKEAVMTLYNSAFDTQNQIKEPTNLFIL